ncbi:hypothetical protein GPALN_001824 [Globodera pallida]|nr:hypothetical protein GPALN_001824 [Globodera pallida]
MVGGDRFSAHTSEPHTSVPTLQCRYTSVPAHFSAETLQCPHKKFILAPTNIHIKEKIILNYNYSHPFYLLMFWHVPSRLKADLLNIRTSFLSNTTVINSKY